MCLDKIDKKTRKFKTGWKVFITYKEKLYPLHRRNATSNIESYPTGTWFKDEYNGSITPTYYGIGTYKSGFHFYKSEKKARFNCEDFNNIVKKIKVRNIVASGTQDGSVVGVAKEIFIEP